MSERKYYIDNLRWISILMLFPYHISMIYNGFESFYIHAGEVRPMHDFILITSTWFMPLLFTLAGASAFYSIKKRTAGQFIKERTIKLLLPAITGTLLLVPIQTFFAEKFHNGYTGSFAAQYILFFTKETDLTGYRGGFTPGHLWFLYYLFVISAAAVPFMRFLHPRISKDRAPLPLPVLLALFLPVYLMTPVLNIAGKSIGQFFTLFMIGFIVFSDNSVIERLSERVVTLFSIAGGSLLLMYYIYYNLGWETGNTAKAVLLSMLDCFAGWSSILALLGFAGNFLNFKNRFSLWMSKVSFSVYIFHQTVIIAAAYFIVNSVNSHELQFLLILLASLPVTFLLCFISAKFKPLGKLFGTA